ncbi:unnamed protein product (mitochondrion) [Plasmodiophora brassicae]|uniref:CCHC-type domain-containing protein n=1 Tax=Plasmodiophora brassicae TaxID=37360 RepID=A0A0G4IGL0_PLABS|nr:hypothetical protein PBRA_000030 [Plasmodiophora brassicae]SPQ96608.1 unnamed protein product [Plasmodiophora brassicae]
MTISATLVALLHVCLAIAVSSVRDEFIYVLAYDGRNRYYVGRTEKPVADRVQEHIWGIKSPWFLRSRDDIELVECWKMSSRFDEDTTTLKYMDEYGIGCVRGGSFVKTFDSPVAVVIRSMLDTANNRCFICHSSGHWASDCLKSTTASDEPSLDCPGSTTASVNSSPAPSPHYVYVLASVDGTHFYVGRSSSVWDRVRRHRRNEFKVPWIADAKGEFHLVECWRETHPDDSRVKAIRLEETHDSVLHRKRIRNKDQLRHSPANCCWRCNEEGHFEHECPFGQTGPLPGSQGDLAFTFNELKLA